jgi:hypothetical protein
VRILVLWNACRGVSADDDASWARAASASLRECEDVVDVSLHAVETAASRHPRACDWCLEMRVRHASARDIVRRPACAEFLADLRLLGAHPCVPVLPEGD